MKNLTCIVCPNGCSLSVSEDGSEIKVTGNKCARGLPFAIKELKSPERSVTTTVKTVFPELPVCPVRTDGEIPKNKIFDLIKIANSIVIDTPLKTGETVLNDLFGTGVNLITTTDISKYL